MLAAAGPTQAQQTLANSQCMQERAGFALNCTANDVSVAGVHRLSNGAYDITITDPCSRAGDDVTFTARFDVVLTAQERHDIGIYFATDGDANGDGALTSDNQAEKKGCSVTTLEWQSGFGGVDLDGTDDPFPGTKKSSGIQDTCGDINAAASPLKPLITVTAKCTDEDADGFLDLPNCVSWRQSGANELCTSPADTFPGAPSKCKCDTGFDVPVPVPANVFVQKKVKLAAEDATAYRELAALDEPGGLVDFQVVFSVDGTANTPDLTLNSLMDDIYGDITKSQSSGNPEIVSTTCSVPQSVAGNDGSYTCSFRVNVGGAAGNPAPDNSKTITDTVTANATDAVGNSFAPTDTAQVTVHDVKPAATLVKDASPMSCAESELPCDVTFSVQIKNDSVSSDPLTFTSIYDSPYGAVTAVGGQIKSTTCSVPQTLAAGATYSCAFVVAINGNANDSFTDTVEATGTDDEGNEVKPKDSAVVSITNVPSSVTFEKTANVSSVKEPGGEVIYTLRVTNESIADSFNVETLVDDRFGEVTQVQGAISATTCSVPQLLTRSGGATPSYTCTFTAYVAGNAGLDHINVATMTGKDDDGNLIELDGTATVNFTNEPPRASLNKTATSLVVTYDVVVTNDSEAEDLRLSSLTDDKLGNITAIQGNVVDTNCSVPQDIPRSGSKDGSGQLNDFYRCTFKAVVDSSPHVNVVTGVVDDDDGDNDAVAPFDSAQVTFGEESPPN